MKADLGLFPDEFSGRRMRELIDELERLFSLAIGKPNLGIEVATFLSTPHMLGMIATQMIADSAITTEKVADNAVSYLATVAGFTVDVTTHGTVASPTTLLVVAKAVIDGIAGTTSMELKLDGVTMDTSTDIYGGVFDPQSSLTTQFMETITDSTSHTISFAVYDTYVGDGVINILEVRR